MSSPQYRVQSQIPVFNLQAHHEKVHVPMEFDMRDLSRKYNVFPLKLVSHSGLKRLLLAMVNPRDSRAIADVEFRAGVTVMPVQADRIDIQWLTQTHYYGRKLSPVASVGEMDVTHDLFKQLEITTNEQEKPDWLASELRAYEISQEPESK